MQCRQIQFPDRGAWANPKPTGSGVGPHGSRGIGEVTQELAGQLKSNWQAPYDERVLEESAGKIRYAFFFHYLDLKKPLITPAGSLPLPAPTSKPAHLKDIEYETP